MALGEKLRQARQEKGLSQRQLCGEEITRNMLSQIENGSAKPSMATLTFLAHRLEKPISYFLEETAEQSPNQDCMTQARQAYEAGQYRQACQYLESYTQPDPVFDSERWLLEALSLLAQAAHAVEEGKTVFAQNLLEKAEAAGAKTVYYTAAQERERLLLLYLADPDSALEIHKNLPQDHRESILRAQVCLEEGDAALADRILDSIPEQTDRWHLLKAEAAVAKKDYAAAIPHYQAAETAAPYACAKALEQCYLELGDYKMAYHYACRQREL